MAITDPPKQASGADHRLGDTVTVAHSAATATRGEYAVVTLCEAVVMDLVPLAVRRGADTHEHPRGRPRYFCFVTVPQCPSHHFHGTHRLIEAVPDDESDDVHGDHFQRDGAAGGALKLNMSVTTPVTFAYCDASSLQSPPRGVEYATTSEELRCTVPVIRISQCIPTAVSDGVEGDGYCTAAFKQLTLAAVQPRDRSHHPMHGPAALPHGGPASFNRAAGFFEKFVQHAGDVNILCAERTTLADGRHQYAGIADTVAGRAWFVIEVPTAARGTTINVRGRDVRIAARCTVAIDNVVVQPMESVAGDAAFLLRTTPLSTITPRPALRK
jgi:hypothetical protein